MKRWKLLLLATGVLIGTVGRARTVEAAGNTYAFSASTKVRSTRAQLSLSAAPATLNFGSVTVGSRAAQTVTLTNTGNSSVSVTAVGVPAGFITSGPTTTLASSQTATFSVIFAPTSTGSVTGNATVFSNASNSVTIALTGSGVQAGLSVTPQSLSFGNVVVGTTNSQTISVSNQGTANLVISHATVS